MKKLLIVNNNLSVGGVQKSLHNLLWTVGGEYDITLLLFHAGGAYLDKLPGQVKVISCPGIFRYFGISQGKCRGVDKLVRGGLALVSRLFGRQAAVGLMLPFQKPMQGHYDCAIAFLHNGRRNAFYGGVQEFVLHKVRARRKVAWLHCDYVTSGSAHPANHRLLRTFDRIAACSSGCANALLTVLPELKEKSVTVPNCHCFDEIRALARENPVEYAPDVTNLVVIARLSREKALHRAIEAVAFCRASGQKAALHLVGGGPMEQKLKALVQARQLEDWVNFYGEQANPYRFLPHADLLLLTSIHEAAPMVIQEAMCLGVPVLTTKTVSSREMVGECGWICENSDQAVAAALAALLEHPASILEKKEKLRRCAWDNRMATVQFLRLIEG